MCDQTHGDIIPNTMRNWYWLE